VITLDHQMDDHENDQALAQAASTVVGRPLSKLPGNLRQFGSARAGESSEIQTLTLRFATADKLTRITSTKDFQIEPSGCIEGGVYEAKSTCTLAVRFTPQGPGHRFGKLTVADTASAEPLIIGLLGESFGPVVSFTPAVITTVPGTYPSGAGLLSGALSLAVDGGDTLYIADTGNNAVRYVDSSGAILSLSSVFGIAAPVGITTDTAGRVYFTHRSTDYLQVLGYAGQATIYDAGSASCAYGTACPLGGQPFDSPGGMATDPSGNVFLNDEGGAVRIVPVPDDIFENGIPLYLQYNYPIAGSLPLAVDAEDNLYSYYSALGNCAIFAQSYYDAETVGTISTRVAGGRTCGYSGDGGPAGNAEIGASVGQFAFDIAGNFYFTDTNNNRVRSVDGATGVIRTIAGNGTAGYSGDGGKATAATLNNPTGLAVTSRGNVYIISSAASGQVIRKVGPQGYITFGNQGKGVASAVQFVRVSNTGNDSMTLTNVNITGANKGDFKIDDTTTTCILTQGAELYSGQSCRIGVIFTPAAVGARAATLTLLDNTSNGADSVTLTGSGVLPAATFTITAPAKGASVTSGTAVKFSVSVTSSSGVQPTGTVQFKVDGANHGSAVTLSGTGTASISVTGLTTGSHTLAATYSGDGNYAAAGPISVSITVKAAATVKLSEPLTTQKLTSRSVVDFVGDVSSKSTPVPTGKVTFSVDGKRVATADIVSGKAAATAPKLASGAHTVSAVYSGDAHHSAAQTSEEITVAR
jgi:hypothetical protein